MAHAFVPPRPSGLHAADLVLWAEDQVRALRDGAMAGLDVPNLIEEISDVGQSQRDAIESRLTVLLTHLLKWRYQPGARSASRQATIVEQRERIARVIRRSPSLRTYPRDVFESCYRPPRLAASRETGIDFTLFPDAAPFTLDQALDPGFLPKQPDLYDQT